jgi:histone-lysine N-methyltransferase SETMAR
MIAKTVRIRDRAIIQFCKNLGYSAAEAFRLGKQAYPQDYPSRALIYKRYAYHSAGGESLDEDRRGGNVRDWDDILHVEDVVTERPSSSITALALETGISRRTVKSILGDNLHIRKLFPILVPYALTDAVKAQRVAAAHEMLDILEAEEEYGFESVVTGDETWVNLKYDEDYRWGYMEEERPLRPRPDFHPKRVMITVFWSVQGFILVEPLPRGDRINARYFQDNILTPLQEKLKDQIAAGPVWLHYDNAPAHTARTTTALVARYGFHKMPHPPYSPDIAPSDFYLFARLKKLLRGTSEETADGMVGRVIAALDRISYGERADVMANWIKRLYKLIEVNGEYVTRYF